MTAGNNGSGTPENDDPFAYLYRSEGDEGEQAGQSAQGGPGSAPRTGGYGYPGPNTPHQPGVPRTSYNHVRAVGERTYGGQQSPAQQGYGQQAYGQQGQQQTQQQPPYGQQNAHYAAPETFPGGAPRQEPPGSHGGRGGGRGRGPNNKGLLIGAIAVVAVVLIGIGVAMITNGDDKKDSDDAGGNSTGAASVEPSDNPQPTKGDVKLPPKQDAASLRLDGGTVTAKDIPGASAKGGTYVAGINTPGASATWSVDLEQKGSYKLYVGYGVPGEDENLTLTVNGKKADDPLNMKNFAKAEKGKWEDGWTYTYAIVNLTKGTNTVKVSCEDGNKCDVNLDQIWLKKG